MKSVVIYLLLTLYQSLASTVPVEDLPSFLFILADDIGWSDFGYNNGTAFTPNIDALANGIGSIKMQDFHSGGTVCSPTRATVLTGRDHRRDCVNGVYGCSDPTECDPYFEFAINNTFTTANAIEQASTEYKSAFWGKWHLGAFYNDSKLPSSPITHGFDHMNATIEVAPTRTTNCNCNKEWESQCEYGHNHKAVHCNGGIGPGGNNCCFNYWSEDNTAEHGVSNLTNFSGGDDSEYQADSFGRFLTTRVNDGNKPFYAHISFHNCHIPYIGAEEERKACANGTICKPGNYSEAQLDFYTCLIELDRSVGRLLKDLETYNYRNNTMIWFTTDNGPEGNCQPEGRCTEEHYESWPGVAAPLRGRKRDIWEGGHRVPGIISWPAVVKGNSESWDNLNTEDFLPTMMEVLGVERPESQKNWALDGYSVLPLLKGGSLPERGRGHVYKNGKTFDYGYRYGKWKLVDGTKSCSHEDCKKPMLFDLSVDLEEKTDLSEERTDIMKQITTNMTEWKKSIEHSIIYESGCSNKNALLMDDYF